MSGAFSLEQAFQEALAGAADSMTGRSLAYAPVASGGAGDGAGTFFWEQGFSQVEGQSFWVAAPAELWQALGRITLQAAGIDDVSEEDSRSTWQEIVNQTMGAIASAMTAHLGSEVTLRAGIEARKWPPHIERHYLRVSGEQGEEWVVCAGWSPELEASLIPAAAPVQSPPARDLPTSKTFELLLDVALPVAVSFGRTSLQIREVLKLNTGSIVELDRFITDPVEVIVNNCVIARGEVVVVDGNYGVRISQLASREERLRTGMAEALHKGAKS